MWVQSLGWGDALEQGVATCFCILVWKTPWTEEPVGGYSPWDSKESDTTEHSTVSTASYTHTHTYWDFKIGIVLNLQVNLGEEFISL